MRDNFAELEQRFIQGYQAQRTLYDRAIAVVEKATHSSVTAGDSLPWLRELNAILSEIAALDATLAKERTVWRFGGRSMGEELSGLLNDVTERIRRLAMHVDSQMRNLQTRRQNLMPEMDEFIKQRRMLHAYGKRR